MIFAVTAPEVVHTERIDFTFFAGHLEIGRAVFCARDAEGDPVRTGRWGVFFSRPWGDDEVNPFNLARGGPLQIGNHKFEVQFFTSAGGLDLSTGCACKPDGGFPKALLDDIGSGVLLMTRTDFDHFERAAEAAGVELQAYHHDQPLRWSKERS